jgi:hypothetical protein
MKKIISISAALSLIVFCFGTVWAAAPATPGANFTVANTPANPVPVTGNVSITSPVEVNINNSATNPMFVSNGGEPYSQDTVGTCNGTNCFINFPVVPAGKRLVILHVGAMARPTLGATIVDFAELLTSNPQNTQIGTRNIFQMQLIGLAGASVVANTYAMNASILAFVEAGQYASLTLAQRSQGVVMFCQGTISGYLLPVPAVP